MKILKDRSLLDTMVRERILIHKVLLGEIVMQFYVHLGHRGFIFYFHEFD